MRHPLSHSRGGIQHPGDVKSNWGFQSTHNVEDIVHVIMTPLPGLSLLMEDLYWPGYTCCVTGRGKTTQEAIEDATQKAAFRQDEVAIKARMKYGD